MQLFVVCARIRVDDLWLVQPPPDGLAQTHGIGPTCAELARDQFWADLRPDEKRAEHWAGWLTRARRWRHARHRTADERETAGPDQGGETRSPARGVGASDRNTGRAEPLQDGEHLVLGRTLPAPSSSP